jgi:dTDP-4-amino-4,6-dideoxygalactose transaminase
LGDNDVALEYSYKYTLPYMPQISNKEYDLAISFLTPHYFVAERVDAKKKIAWIHTVTPNYAYFPVVFEEKEFGATRTEVFDKLAENGIGARKYFYPLTNTFSAFHGKYDVMETPVALHISKRVLTLPIYADLALEDVDCICRIILSLRHL